MPYLRTFDLRATHTHKPWLPPAVLASVSVLFYGVVVVQVRHFIRVHATLSTRSQGWLLHGVYWSKFHFKLGAFCELLVSQSRPRDTKQAFHNQMADPEPYRSKFRASSRCTFQGKKNKEESSSKRSGRRRRIKKKKKSSSEKMFAWSSTKLGTILLCNKKNLFFFSFFTCQSLYPFFQIF